MKKFIPSLIAALIFSASLQGQQKKPVSVNSGSSEVRKLAYADSRRLAEIFKDLHANPELAFLEVPITVIKCMILCWSAFQTQRYL